MKQRQTLWRLAHLEGKLAAPCWRLSYTSKTLGKNYGTFFATMSNNMPLPITKVVDFAKTELAQEGVEVKGWGTDTVTLRLPYELPDLNEIIANLISKVGGEITFQNTDAGGVLVVTPDPAHAVKSAPRQQINSVRLCIWIAICGVLGMVALLLVFRAEWHADNITAS